MKQKQKKHYYSPEKIAETQNKMAYIFVDQATKQDIEAFRAAKALAAKQAK